MQPALMRSDSNGYTVISPIPSDRVLCSTSSPLSNPAPCPLSQPHLPRRCAQCGNTLYSLVTLIAILSLFFVGLVLYAYMITKHKSSTKWVMSSGAILVTHLQTVEIISKMREPTVGLNPLLQQKQVHSHTSPRPQAPGL